MVIVDLKLQAQEAISLINSGKDSWVPFYSSLSNLHLPAKEQLVLLTLQRFSFHYTIVCPTIRHLAQEIRISKSSVQRAVIKLAAIGLISYRKEGRGLHKHNVYTVLYSPTPVPKNSPSAKREPPPVTNIIGNRPEKDSYVASQFIPRSEIKDKGNVFITRPGYETYIQKPDLFPMDDPEWIALFEAQSGKEREALEIEKAADAKEREKVQAGQQEDNVPW